MQVYPKTGTRTFFSGHCDAGTVHKGKEVTDKKKQQYL